MDGEAYLYDAETGITHNLSTGEYNFTAENGVSENRFSIMLKSDNLSGIGSVIGESSDVKVSSTQEGVEIIGGNGSLSVVYALDGTTLYKKVLTEDYTMVNLAKGIYIVVVNGHSYKIVVK